MTTETTKLGLTKATYGELPGSWDTFERQDRDRLEDRLTTQFAGNPNGNVAGYWKGQFSTDTTNNRTYVCSASGSATVATWTELASWINAIGQINALTALTAPAVGDLLPVWDLSASGNRSMSFTDMLKVVASLTALSASDTDLTNDQVLIYDASASDVRRGTPQSFSGIDPIAYSARYMSASTAFTLGSQLSFTHSLGAQAKGAQAWFKNVSTQGGFAAGEMFLGHQYHDSGMRGITIAIVDATTVRVIVNAVAGVFGTLDGTSNFTMTASNWAIVLEAWT